MDETMTDAKKPTSIPVLFVLLLIVVAVVGFKVVGLFRSADITIGGKDFTEQSVLCEMMAILVEENTDLTVDRRPFLGGTMVCFNGLKGGQLDVYAEYTGTGLVNILGRDGISDPNEALDAVRQAFAEDYAITWLEPFGFNNTYTLTMRRQQAVELGIRTFSDLADYVNKGNEPRLTAGFTHEFLDRPDGYRGLCQAYDFEFAEEPLGLDPGRMYQGCANEEVDVICAFATDGRIAAFDLVTLEDDRQFFPPYSAAPLIRNETLEEHPELRDLLNKLAGLIDDETMQQLNYQVDRKENPRRARDVAREFLEAHGLIPFPQP